GGEVLGAWSAGCHRFRPKQAYSVFSEPRPTGTTRQPATGGSQEVPPWLDPPRQREPVGRPGSRVRERSGNPTRASPHREGIQGRSRPRSPVSCCPPVRLSPHGRV